MEERRRRRFPQSVGWKEAKEEEEGRKAGNIAARNRENRISFRFLNFRFFFCAWDDMGN